MPPIARTLVLLAAAALAGCGHPPLPEGQYLGLVAERRSVEVAGPAGTRPAYEWTVKLDGGRRVVFVQAEPMFAIGQRVRVITGDGPTRMEIP